MRRYTVVLQWKFLMKYRFTLSALLLVVFSRPVLAEPAVQFDAWARATPPGSTSGAIYGVISNGTGAQLELADAVFSGAHHVMVHRTVYIDGMARMKHADVALQPEEAVILAPDGLHIMLMGLSSPLVEGCRYSVQLKWDDGQSTDHSFVTGDFGQMSKPSDVGEVCD